jgi:DNA-binding winged helix-turn-helix (wHTH) protein
VETYSSLYVERGEPFQAGSCLDLSQDEIVVGRPSQGYMPDVAFSNAFVSRKHLRLQLREGKVYATDLGSKHGTQVNGIWLEPHTPYMLSSTDTIVLAKGMVVLHFAYRFADHTLELEPKLLAERLQPTYGEHLKVDREKRLCRVDGRVVSFSEKEWSLFLLLFEQPDTVIANEAIKRHVWPERALDADGVPDVGLEELNSLVYRIRRKIGKDRFPIQTVRGKGYVFERN